MANLAAIIIVPDEIAIKLDGDENFLSALEEICSCTIMGISSFKYFSPTENQIAIAYLPEREISRAGISADFFRKAEVEQRFLVITERPKFQRKAKTPKGMVTERTVKESQFSKELLLAFVKAMHRAFS